MMRFIILIFLWIQAINAQIWSLDSCIKQALLSNLSYEAAKLNEKSASLALQKAKSSRYPDLSASINNSLSDRPFVKSPQDHYRLSAGLSSSMNLWDGGVTRQNIESKSLYYQSVLLDIEQNKLELLESVVTLFVSVVSAKESVKIAEASLYLAQEETKKMEFLLEAGTKTPKDLILSKANLSQKNLLLLLAKQSYESERNALRQLLNLPRDMDFDLHSADWEKIKPQDLKNEVPLEVLLNAALQNSPKMKSDSHHLLISKKEEFMASKTSSIKVSLGASASTGWSAWESKDYSNQVKETYSHGISLGVSIPILDRSATKNNVLQAQINALQSQIQHKNSKKQLENLLELLYLNTLSSISQWEAAILETEAATEAFRVIGEQWSLGLISYTEFLEQKNKLEAAEFNQNKAKYNSILYQKKLELYYSFPI